MQSGYPLCIFIDAYTEYLRSVWALVQFLCVSTFRTEKIPSR